MLSRRSKAVVEFGFGVFLSWFVLWFRHFRYKSSEKAPANRLEPLSALGMISGAATSVASIWLSDHDVWKVRTNRGHRFLFSLIRFGLRRYVGQYTSDSIDYKESHNLGTALGIVVYRLWYGLLRPLPESRGRDGR